MNIRCFSISTLGSGLSMGATMVWVMLYRWSVGFRLLRLVRSEFWCACAMKTVLSYVHVQEIQMFNVPAQQILYSNTAASINPVLSKAYVQEIWCSNAPAKKAGSHAMRRKSNLVL